MRHYELMVILDPELEERTVAPSLDRVLNVVRKGGGVLFKKAAGQYGCLGRVSYASPNLLL